MKKSITFALFFALCLLGLSWSFSGQKDEPFGLDSLVPVDTARLLNSPDPLPMEIEKAYPNLRFNRPLEYTHAGDGSKRVFVVEQDGLIHVFPQERGVKKTKIFLDLRKVVLRADNEEGLLGLAFHPRYKQNGEFFVYYSARPRVSIISRFRVSKESPDRADRSSEEVLLRIPQPYGNHNGGSMKFGPDGFLYIGMGDGGGWGDPHGNGQNLESLHGSMLRIDIDRKDAGKKYAIPKDNPFVGRGGKVRGEIWAKGLRNVWRLSFDRANGTLWVGDVGQDRFEEINIIVRGGNYGWKVREGMHFFDRNAARFNNDFIEPILEYSRDEGKSITGGLVYRGKRLPELIGAYLYADYVTGNVWALRWDGKRVVSNQKIVRSGLPITAFGEDEEGEVCFTSFDGFLYQFRPAPKRPQAGPFPRKLSETGLFASVKELKPVPGLIPYSVNVPLWSDHALKDRYLALPAKGKVVFSDKEPWQFPVGAVLVKTFSLEGERGLAQPAAAVPRRLETRLLVNSRRGWEGYTYLWNDEQTDAELLADAPLVKEYPVKTANGMTNQQWYFPSRSDCAACHTKAAGFALGLNTRQMNRTHDYGKVKDNQLRSMAHAGVFSAALPRSPAELDVYPEWGSKNAPTATLARAYLDANCAMCHAPGSTGNAKIDLRFHTPLANTFLIRQPPSQGRLGPSSSRLITPGSPQRSELFHRMSTRGNGQMPNIATSITDQEAIQLITQWIKEMPPKPAR